MELKSYHLHPAAVHFPIALLIAGAAAAAARFSRRAPAWFPDAERWLLRLGTASAWVALALGWWAEKTAPHKPLAWEVLADHETLAWWTCGVFTVLVGFELFGRRAGKKSRPLELALWATGLALLVATAMHGGELVYGFGMGSAAP